jgi:hypothetical protein
MTWQQRNLSLWWITVRIDENAFDKHAGCVRVSCCHGEETLL